MKYDLSHAIINLYPTGAKFVLEGNFYSGLKWFDERPKPTEKELNDKIAELQADYDAKQYQRDRAVEYPSIEGQLDEIFHKGLTEWKKTIQAVKDKHPKPTE